MGSDQNDVSYIRQKLAYGAFPMHLD